jgi:[calcium/calmodulin-dependent protein kinase] kinase
MRGLRANESDDALFLIREEMAIMKKLNHPNLVQLYEVLDDPEEDSLYMVMEMCKAGVVMKVALGIQATPYSENECRCWFRDLVLGIEYRESLLVPHRPTFWAYTDPPVKKYTHKASSTATSNPTISSCPMTAC